MFSPTEAAKQQEELASPLAASLPSHLLKKLERRNTPKKVTSPEKENGVGVGSVTAVSPALKTRRRSINNPPCTPECDASPAPRSSPATRSSPSAAAPAPLRGVAREAAKLESARKLRRQQHESARSARADFDETSEFREMIATYRSTQPPPPTAAAATGDAARSSSGRLRVCVRKRPLLRHEVEEGNEFDVLSCIGKRAVLHQTRRTVDQTRELQNHSFTFDELFDADCDTAEVYARTAKPLVSSVFAGGRATCFAYGQTGSGKTYTMMGDGEDGVGIYGLCAADLFARLEAARAEGGVHLHIVLSMYEIYRETVFDLLGGGGSALQGGALQGGALPGGGGGKVQVLEDGAGEVQLVGLAEVEPEDAAHVMRLVESAHAKRSTGNNSVNERSSRSHAVLQLVLRDRRTAVPLPGRGSAAATAALAGALGGTVSAVGKMTLVDLAGSERAADTQEAGSESRAEGADINKSLLTLKECIRAMDEGHSHVPFRGSKLTQILRDSFTHGASATTMISHVSPANRFCEYSLNSLRYAERLRATVASGEPADKIGSAPRGAANATAGGGGSARRAAPPACTEPASPARRPPRAPGAPFAPPAAAVAAAAPPASAAPVAASSAPGPSVSVSAPPPPPPTASPAAATAIAAEAPALATAAAASGATPDSAGPGVSISSEKKDKAVGVLQDLLRCAYDVEAWKAEVALLETMKEEDILGCVDRVDAVLTSRVELFTKLQGSLASFKHGLLKQHAVQ